MRRIHFFLLFGVLILNFRWAEARSVQCSDIATLKIWIQSFQEQARSKKIKPDKLKQLYLGSSNEAQLLTLFYPQIFKDKVLTSQLAIDCNDNLLKILYQKLSRGKAEFYKNLWSKCVVRLYEDQAQSVIQKTISCLEK